jgi:hypothetical protein
MVSKQTQDKRDNKIEIRQKIVIPIIRTKPSESIVKTLGNRIFVDHIYLNESNTSQRISQ